jgi:hypothetical protein
MRIEIITYGEVDIVLRSFKLLMYLKLLFYSAENIKERLLAQLCRYKFYCVKTSGIYSTLCTYKRALLPPLLGIQFMLYLYFNPKWVVT